MLNGTSIARMAADTADAATARRPVVLHAAPGGAIDGNPPPLRIALAPPERTPGPDPYTDDWEVPDWDIAHAEAQAGLRGFCWGLGIGSAAAAFAFYAFLIAGGWL